MAPPKADNLANRLAPPRYHPRIRPNKVETREHIPSSRMLRDELDATMGMCGRPTVADIDRDIIGSLAAAGHVPAVLGQRAVLGGTSRKGSSFLAIALRRF